MKYTCLLLMATVLLSSTTLPPSENYDKMWKNVQQMEQKGLIRSALSEVEKIYTKAQTERSYPNWVQAYIYKNKYQSQLEEEGQAKVLLRFEEDIPTMPEPVKSILHHYAGQYFHQYLQSNQYRLNQRTELLIEDNSDIRTWSIDRLEKRTRYHILKSIGNKELVHIKAQDYKNLFTNDFKVKWDVSLYDQIIYHGLQLFENNSINHKPTNRFVIDSNIVFLNANDFANAKLDVTGTSDYNYQALHMYQQWMAIHLSRDEKALALINAKRLSLAYRLTNASDKYLAALQAARNEAGETACVYDYYIAQYYIGIGARYGAMRNEEHRTALIKAHEIASACENCSILQNACDQLIHQLEESSMSISIENVNQINKPILTQIYFKNQRKLYYHIYRLNEKNWFDNFYDQKGNLKIPADAPHIRTVPVQLIKDRDYQSHSFEMSMDALSAGQYFLVLTNTEKIPSKTAGRRVETVKFQVSDMAVLNRSMPGQQTFYITNRDKGNPLDNVSVDFYHQAVYPAQGLSSLIKTVRSDQDGKFVDKLEPGEDKRRRNRQQKIIVLRNGDDKLVVDRNYYINNVQSKARDRAWTQFFTDRAIYRPGQTIHFKGIHLNRNSEQINSILPNTKLTVSLRDANNREIGQADFTTNEFGSFNGTFQIPVGTLNGRFSLRTSGGSHAVQVEEYKRPTFEAVFDTLRGDYVIGEQIDVSGLAKNLAGNVLQNATGRYRVTRSTYFPYGFNDHYFRICFPHFQTNEEVANGEIEIGDDGKFEISFGSIQDQQFNKIYKPVHNYQIVVTVVDETGESHDFTQSITVGPTAVKVMIEHDAKIDLSAESNLILKCTNFNGVPKNIPGAFTIRKMNNPNGYIRKNSWPAPDIVLDNPNSAEPKWSYYKDMHDSANWGSDKLITRQKMIINEQQKINLSKHNLEAGKYLIRFVGTDTFGNTVKSESYVDVFDSQKKEIPAYQHHYLTWDKKNYEPGETVTLNAYSADEIWVLIAEDRKLLTKDAKWVKVDGHKSIDFQVRESDRGNFSVNTMIVSKDRLFQEVMDVKVPWSNKDLKIEYLTFRDKLIPGQEEKWIIKLSGAKKDKVAAELVASLYDASLDAFKDHQWTANFFPLNYNRTHWTSYGFEGRQGYYQDIYASGGIDFIQMPYWNWFGLMNHYGGRGRVMMRGEIVEESMMMDGDAMAMNKSTSRQSAPSAEAEMDAVQIDDNGAAPVDQKPTAPLVRTNLQETVFFYPDLRTDEEGNVLIEFTMGEALTKWKLLTFAHSKELEYAFDTKELVTQKDFMVFPLFPRFFREYDQIRIKSKVVNLTDTNQDIDVRLVLQDGVSKEDKAHLFNLDENVMTISLGPNESKTVSWDIEIPSIIDINTVTTQVIAQSGNKSDGEEHLIPILTNRKLVTEALPLPLKSNETRSWTLSDLKELLASSSAELYNVSLEVSSNPAWYAVLALPYLEEQSHESTSAKMSRFYSNQLASFVIQKNPKIKDVFAAWKNMDTRDDLNAFMSHLEKNQELKYVVLNQTPWVAQAKSEEDQRRRIALLFDMNKLAQQKQQTWSAILNMQNSDGGFSWMPGGRSNWHTTLHVLSSLAHLQELQAMDVSGLQGANNLIQRAVHYSDRQLKQYMERLRRSANQGGLKLEKDHLSYSAIYHLYVRSQFDQIQSGDNEEKEIRAYFLGQAEQYWINKNLYAQGLIALLLNRYNRKNQVPTILQSLKERSLEHEELGRYWKYQNGYYWYQRPIETQALMIEVFHELTDDREFVEALKIWLLKHKQTNHWKTSTATSEAVFALLSTGPSLLESNELVRVHLSDAEWKPEQAQAGTGYFKKSWNKNEITSALTEIKLSNPNDNIAYGGMYWQYFEDLDKIKTYEKTPITIQKSITKETMTKQGPKLVPVDEDTQLEIGDRVIIRIEIRVDREMEYVHLQDMRSSGLEPTQVISGYRWQDGMGYYQTIKDASADFFIGYLPKGTFVFEYPLKVSHTGNFSNGITTIQSYYAPEFTSHSAGERVVVK